MKRQATLVRTRSQASAAPAGSRPKHGLAGSKALHDRARRVIPGCSQTFSKAPEQFVQGVAPVFLERGQGAVVWDVDGNSYLDWSMALCAVVLGYGDPDVTAAVQRQLQDGIVLTLPHPLEVEVAERLTRLIPCAEMVRFAKNGSDATSGAVRLARACTKREMIACCGYHGWQDWYIGTTTRNLGVPTRVAELTVRFDYNDLAGLEQVFRAHPGRIAAVIMEPVGVEPPTSGFLEGVRALCTREGALLVFDEIVTGFRMALGGAQEWCRVIPDLACFGKAMANGFPISALVGRRQYMQRLEEVFFSFTFGGDAVALAAARATIDKLEHQTIIPFLWQQGTALANQFNELVRRTGLEQEVACLGYAPRTVVVFPHPDARESLIRRSFFQQECIKRGLLFTGAHNVALCHTDAVVEQTLSVYEEVLRAFKGAVEKGDVARRLAGAPVQPVFRTP